MHYIIEAAGMRVGGFLCAAFFAYFSVDKARILCYI